MCHAITRINSPRGNGDYTLTEPPHYPFTHSENGLLKWVGRLPVTLCRRYPMLCLWHAWALLFVGQLDAVEPTLRVAEAHRARVPDLPIVGYATTVRAYVANQVSDLARNPQGYALVVGVLALTVLIFVTSKKLFGAKAYQSLSRGAVPGSEQRPGVLGSALIVAFILAVVAAA